jgi:hypothetical protein
VSHTCHTPGASTVSDSNSRVKRPIHQRIRWSCSRLFRDPDLPSWGSSSALHDELSRFLRVKAKPLRGRFASHDMAATAKGMAATRRTGEVQGSVSSSACDPCAAPGSK